MRKEAPARVILVRHLDTPAIPIRTAVKKDPALNSLRAFFIGKQPSSIADIAAAEDIARALHARSVEKYGWLLKDALMPISDGQQQRGQAIGEALLAAYGPITRWETSPYLRTRQTSALLREGMKGNNLPRERRNRELREKDFGDAQTYHSPYIYLATHPQAATDYFEQGRDNYVFPNGESSNGFKRRMHRHADRLERRKKYRGTTIIVAHSAVIEELTKKLTKTELGNKEISTGSVTVLDAAKKRYFKPREFHLVGRVGQNLVAVKTT